MSIDIPKELVSFLDKAAGREHSKDGSVIKTLGQLLDMAEKLKSIPGSAELVGTVAGVAKRALEPKKTQRPDWDDYFLNIAQAVSLRGDCSRRSVGAVIVKDHRIVSTGYNGTVPGGPSCLNGDCPRASKSDILHGDPDYSNCIALHAEQNAIAYANWLDTLGATIYLTSDPCDMCSKLIQAAGIVRVVHGEPLNSTEASTS